MSVDFPEPDGPMMALKRPRSKAVVTPAQGIHRGVPLSVAPQVGADDDLVHGMHSSIGQWRSQCG